MISEQTLALVRETAEDLRKSGQLHRAEAIEALLNGCEVDPVPNLDSLTTSGAAQLLGVTGQTIKNWVRKGKLPGYRLGARILIPRTAVDEYVRRARGSLELPEIADEEAALLVSEQRCVQE